MGLEVFVRETAPGAVPRALVGAHMLGRSGCALETTWPGMPWGRGAGADTGGSPASVLPERENAEEKLAGEPGGDREVKLRAWRSFPPAFRERQSFITEQV